MNKMKKHSSRVLLSLLYVISLSLTLGSCVVFERIGDEGKEQQTNIRDETYSIDSSILLESIEQGKKDAFILLTATPASYPTQLEIPVRWNQSDYLTIAQAFYSTGWQDNLNNWQLKDLFFGLKCSEITYGPQSAGFNYFKIEQNEGRVFLVLRHLFIAANDNLAVLSETEYYPEIEKWQTLNLASIAIPAEDALKIAEQYGGAQFRKRIDNNCSINAEISPGNNGEVWIISYSGLANQKNNFFKLKINANTGENIKDK